MHKANTSRANLYAQKTESERSLIKGVCKGLGTLGMQLMVAVITRSGDERRKKKEDAMAFVTGSLIFLADRGTDSTCIYSSK